MALSDQHQRFVAEYLIDLNATQAAIRAGYSEKTARVQGSRLLTNADIAAAIAAGSAKRLRKAEVDADTVLGELLRLATVDIAGAYDQQGNLKPIHDIPEDVRRAIAGVEVDQLWEGQGKDRRQVGIVTKVKFWDKHRSLESLGKHLKLFTERLEVDMSEDVAEILRAARERARAR